MTSSYAPSGRRVGLEGPSGRGFNPVQAADSSRSTERQGLIALDSFAKAREVDLANRAKNLEGLIGLSETATKFFVERQQGINENDRKLGIADILNGDLKPKPEALQEYRANVQQLEVSAFGENAAITELQKTEPEAAIEIREKDPVVNAWRAYGQAQGKAQRAGAAAEALLTGLMQNKEPTVAIPGSDRLVSPAEAMTMGPSAFQAAWAVSMQAFINETGLDGLNPILLSESVSPQIALVRSKLLGQSLRATAERQQGEARDQFQTKVGSDLAQTDTTNAAAVTNWWNNTTATAKDALGVATQTEANTETLKAGLALAIIRNDQSFVDNLQNTPVNPNDPNGITLAQHPVYGPMLLEASTNLQKAAEVRAERAEKFDKEAADQVWQAAQLEAQQANDPRDFQLVKEKAQKALEQLGTPAATARLIDLNGLAFNGQAAFREGILARLRAGDRSITKRQIDTHILKGELASSDEALFAQFFPEDTVGKEIDKMLPEIIGSIDAAFRAKFKGIAIPPEMLAGGGLLGRRNQLGREVLDDLKRYAAANPNFKIEQLRQLAETSVQKGLGDPRFTFTIASTDENSKDYLKPKWQVPLVNGVVPPIGGPTSRAPAVDYSNVPAIEIRGGRTTDQYGGPLDKALEQIKAGKNPTGEIVERAKASGLTTDAFVNQQLGLPVDQRIPAMRFESVLRNPRATALQKQAALTQKSYVQSLKAKPQATGGLETSFAGSPAFRSFLDTLGRVESSVAGYDGEAGSTTGIKGLSGMTVAQVMELQRSRPNAMGRYQIIPSTMKEVVRRLGIDPNTTKFDVATQDRMALNLLQNRKAAWDYITGKSNDQAAAETALSQEWAALFSAGGRGFYDGDGRNKATTASGPMLQAMRASYLRRGTQAMGVTTTTLSKANIQSITLEEPGKDRFQPGVDIYFKDGQFPSVVQGRVKEVGFQGSGRGPSGQGYGNFVVIETTDPETGETYDVLKSHLDRIDVKEGESVSVGTIIGKQGSTGRTSAYGISSIDFLAAAPRGSGSQTPYKRWRQERARVIAQFK